MPGSEKPTSYAEAAMPQVNVNSQVSAFSTMMLNIYQGNLAGYRSSTLSMILNKHLSEKEGMNVLLVTATESRSQATMATLKSVRDWTAPKPKPPSTPNAGSMNSNSRRLSTVPSAQK